MRADAKKNYEHILAVASVVVTEHGADASLRDIARRAGVGLGTLYRHFPTREALLEALLRASFDEFTTKARELETASSSDDALVSWLRDVVAFTGNYQGVVDAMMAAKEDPESALHASCVTMRTAGTRLLTRAQAEGLARTDMDGDDLFSLAAALAWLSNQPSSAPRAEHLFTIIASAILTNRASSDFRASCTTDD
ncbi:TetR/AcrR family transcriptional regulator [Priestia megaterium]|uniref:TetR/AcrR family transcriptional regulator n=2 Tax=Bacillaceae TaxID=186817 RepID=UPI0024535F31|nr:helix-turn-helix domain-containing protein [Priestia megaterium]MDH3139168.1 helix-turn-helix domain containing protein [Priestia megaterium]MED4241092.1 helix-turn-helix domain containing protein [Priestia megaterium]MED4268484.1 helix-turn-helix domain containing protein [Priestia megaterium]MED4280134.1 helix-turn-helix domain containing protein [Priestia megaterium]MED4319106.1 helix-turn-helix domain containing protein [Priestia megaterium]